MKQPTPADVLARAERELADLTRVLARSREELAEVVAVASSRPWPWQRSAVRARDEARARVAYLAIEADTLTEKLARLGVEVATMRRTLAIESAAARMFVRVDSAARP